MSDSRIWRPIDAKAKTFATLALPPALLQTDILIFSLIVLLLKIMTASYFFFEVFLNFYDISRHYSDICYPCVQASRESDRLGVCIRECSSTLYVGLQHAVPPINTKFKPLLLLTQLDICYTNHHKHRTSYFKSTLTFLGLAKCWKSISTDRQKQEILAISSSS